MLRFKLNVYVVEKLLKCLIFGILSMCTICIRQYDFFSLLFFLSLSHCSHFILPIFHRGLIESLHSPKIPFQLGCFFSFLSILHRYVVVKRKSSIVWQIEQKLSASPVRFSFLGVFDFVVNEALRSYTNIHSSDSSE